ncbi:MAG: TIGR03936 family radical SAM-associated protein [Defluviitaleaceae bacterium]|nr:TIGR03936 family radical SAM-associated protein [Defluviitaleaceae bacterium]
MLRTNALIRYSKTGAMKYVGHLDLLRIFQRAIRRCGLPVNFSEGFNPHLRVSFALPLTLGMDGLREYTIFEMGEEVPPDEIRGRLGAVLPAGMAISGVRYMAPEEKSPAALLCAADYELRFGDDSLQIKIGEAARILMESVTTEVEKKTEKGSKTVDIRPDIFEMTASGNTVKMKIAAGSVRSLKPELVAQAIAPGTEYACTRLEMYKRDGEGFAGLF